MNSLTVLYDAECGLCIGCKHWVKRQGTYFPVHFLAQGGTESAQRYPDLVTEGAAEELIAISDTGDVYRNDKAWLMVLYALTRYRPLALRLARPAMREMARQAYCWVSRRRHSISKRLGAMPEREMRETLAQQPKPSTCKRPPDYRNPDDPPSICDVIQVEDGDGVSPQQLPLSIRDSERP